MKKILLPLSAAALILIGACSDNSAKNEGGEQVSDPVMNSGANTEGERATDAVSDSATDSGVEKNKDAMSTPH